MMHPYRLHHRPLFNHQNQKQEATNFLDDTQKELPVHKQTTSEKMQEICKNKNRAKLFYF
jgi:hypothetical protein